MLIYIYMRQFAFECCFVAYIRIKAFNGFNAFSVHPALSGSVVENDFGINAVK